jgi:glycosyltransferase involved in cell wall biosynthesis
MSAPDQRVAVLQFAEEGDTSGFFSQVARWHDRERFRMIFGTLKPMPGWLQDAMTSSGVRSFSCGASSRAGLPAAFVRLAAILRRERVDVVHTHLFEPSVVGLAAATLVRTPVRVLTRHYSNYHTRLGKTWHTFLDRACIRMADRVIAVSQHTKDHLVAEEGAPAGKVQVVLNGIDFDRIRVSSHDAPRRIRNELAPGAAIILVAGRLHPEKGQSFLFQALPEVKRRVQHPFRVLVAGTGPSERAYRSEVTSLGCDDVVRFLGFRTDIADLMAAADLLVLPSVAEAFGLALAEALYLGTPVLASRIGGIPEIVADGRDGVLVAAESSRALADALSELLTSPGRLAGMRNAGRAKVIERFPFSVMMHSYEAIYDALLADRRS